MLGQQWSISCFSQVLCLIINFMHLIFLLIYKLDIIVYKVTSYTDQYIHTNNIMAFCSFFFFFWTIYILITCLLRMFIKIHWHCSNTYINENIL